MTKTVLITRFKSDDKKEEDFTKLKDWLPIFIDSEEIDKVYIICNKNDKKELNKFILNNDKIDYVVLKNFENPTSPTAMNIAIKKLSKEIPQLIIIASKEIDIKKEHIKELISEISNKKKKLLVVGYRFKINDNDIKLNKELRNYYKNQDLIAYQVPWNTCAIWNYELFIENVKAFDEITDTNPFCDICVCIKDLCYKTPHKGMEDGLAIAKAVSQKQGLKYKLIKKGNLPSWEINPYRKLEHRQKLARKDTVLRNFMAIRGYSVEDLKKADIS